MKPPHFFLKKEASGLIPQTTRFLRHQLTHFSALQNYQTSNNHCKFPKSTCSWLIFNSDFLIEPLVLSTKFHV